MTNGFKMFLLAAEELNFSRAAERAFVTQQCLSDHIKRLEEMYHVTLFQRKPRLQLTPEGHAMLRYLSRMQALEDSMINEPVSYTHLFFFTVLISCFITGSSRP